jgi:hypothetical protein
MIRPDLVLGKRRGVKVTSYKAAIQLEQLTLADQVPSAIATPMHLARLRLLDASRHDLPAHPHFCSQCSPSSRMQTDVNLHFRHGRLLQGSGGEVHAKGGPSRDYVLDAQVPKARVANPRPSNASLDFIVPLHRQSITINIHFALPSPSHNLAVCYWHLPCNDLRLGFSTSFPYLAADDVLCAVSSLLRTSTQPAS